MTIPLVTITLGGLTCEFLWTLRNACTRDDVCYFGKPPFEDYTRIKKNLPPPIKKFRTYNQRYFWPPGLVAALKDDMPLICRGRIHSQNYMGIPSWLQLFGVAFNELTPLFVIMGAAVLGLGYAIVRNGLTRDDVRFYSGGKTNSEDIENWGPRKLLVFNQKYEMPKGLKEALAALEEPSSENESETVKKSK